MAASNPSRGALRVVTFGEALVVLVAEPGPLERSDTFARSLGGAEANVAVALASQGLDVAMITRVGDDGFGRYLRERLRALGVDTSAVLTDPIRRTGVYVKEVGGTSNVPTDLGVGASAMHYYRSSSAGSHMDPALIGEPGVAALLADAAVVHTSGITLALSDSAVATQRALIGSLDPTAIVSFDLNWRPWLWHGRHDSARVVLDEAMRGCDIALTGIGESAAVFGTTTPEDIRRRFPEPRWLIVKDDDAAVVAFDGDRREVVPAHRVDAVESTGAGDAFAAGVLAGLLAADTLRDMVERGHRTAAGALRSTEDHVAGARGSRR